MHTLSNVEISQYHAVINGRSLNSSSACHSHTTEMDTIRFKSERAVHPFCERASLCIAAGSPLMLEACSGFHHGRRITERHRSCKPVFPFDACFLSSTRTASFPR